MSRVGKLPIPIPDKVNVTASAGQIKVKGPKGELRRQVPELIDVRVDKGEVVVTRKAETREAGSLHGLVRTLIQNMVTGVSKGFSKGLEIVGVGYRAEMRGRFIQFNLGHSHPILFELPEQVTASIEGGTKISLASSNKEVLGQTAATIRSFRPPEPYKGKGIRYEGEVIRTKVGKAGA